MTADQLSKESLAAPKIEVEDLQRQPAANPATVVFRTDGEYQGTGSGRKWFVTAVVTNLAVNDEQVRNGLVKLGAIERIVPYMLSNRPRTPPDFSLGLSSPWHVSNANDAATVLVATGEQAVRGIRLANALLIEKGQGATITTSALELCDYPSGDCKLPELIPSQTSKTLYLRVREGQRPLGRFSGAVGVAIDSRAEPKTVTVELASSAAGARWLGSGLIVAGVFLAWQLSVWSRARLDRLAALKPAIAARKRIEALLARLDAAKRVPNIDWPGLRKTYQDIADGLTEPALDGEQLLPSRIPALWRQTSVSELAARLQALEAPIAGLTIVIRDGIEPLVQRWVAATPGSPSAAAVAEGLKQLDAPQAAATEASARELVKAALITATPPSVLEGQERAHPTAETAALALERISAEIESISIGVWVTYLLLVSIGGIALLIVNNPGFGAPMDFVYCLFWGFGLPVTLDKLQQLSPAGVSSALTISLPK